MLQLSKNERELIEYVNTLRVIAVCVMLFGIGGIGLGFYSIWLRPMSSDAKRLVFSLFGYSIGFIIMGWLLNKMCQIIQKIDKQV